jgi:heat shock protein HslJ
MKMGKPLFLTVFLILALSGCLNLNWGKTQDISEDEVESQLLTTKWRLQSFGLVGEEKSVIPDTKVTIQFGKDNKITGSAGCNSYFTSYEIGSHNSLSFGLIGSTRMFCEGIMEQEVQYIKALENVSTFMVDQNSLKLLYDGGRSVLTFDVTDN